MFKTAPSDTACTQPQFSGQRLATGGGTLALGGVQPGQEWLAEKSCSASASCSGRVSQREVSSLSVAPFRHWRSPWLKGVTGRDQVFYWWTLIRSWNIQSGSSLHQQRLRLCLPRFLITPIFILHLILFALDHTSLAYLLGAETSGGCLQRLGTALAGCTSIQQEQGKWKWLFLHLHLVTHLSAGIRSGLAVMYLRTRRSGGWSLILSSFMKHQQRLWNADFHRGVLWLTSNVNGIIIPSLVLVRNFMTHLFSVLFFFSPSGKTKQNKTI